MNRKIPSCLLLFALLCFCACGGNDHSHDAADLALHDQEAERPTVAVTNWTDRTELFMEYPLFVAGESGRSAIHITDLVDFSPLNAGEATVTLKSGDGTLLEFRGGPSRPGIFGVDLEVDRAGTYEMTLRVEAPGLQDLHELGAVTVYPAGEFPSESEEEDEGISFLKEQQWTLEFGTAMAESRSLRNSVTVPAIVQPRAGGEVLLSAPVPGQIDPGSKVPVPGSRVLAGDLLARIVPRSDALRDVEGLRAALVEAEQDHGLAVSERARVGRLVEARALPARRLDEAEAALAASIARLEAARERWSRVERLSHTGLSGSGDLLLEVRAPFDGVVTEVRYAPGAGVDENQLLARLVDPDRVHIVGSVPESSATDLHSIDAGELLLRDEPPIALPRPLSVGQVVEPVTRTIEVRFALDNRAMRLAVGRSVGLRLFLGDAQPGTAIPDSAIVDDAGRPVVFVQTGGESFARRPVRLGSRAEGWVHVLEGLEPGEWVVTRGAYLVRLAAMSTQIPAHGHVH